MTTSDEYRADIDGLRALAIMSVVLYHANLQISKGGFVGVDIFFVISGYLIGGHLLSQIANGKLSFSSFYKRRIQRIAPAVTFVVSLTIVLAYVLESPSELLSTVKSGLAAILTVSNIYFERHTNYFQGASDTNPVLMTWSLGVEEQFYLVVPILMTVLMRGRQRVGMVIFTSLCLASLLYSSVTAFHNPSHAFYSIQSRFWELGAGVMLARGLRWSKCQNFFAEWRETCSWVGVSLIAASVCMIEPGWPFPGILALPPVLGAALVISARGSWLNSRVISSAPLVGLGKISYSWYLWHWPMLAFARLCCVFPISPHIAEAIAVLSLIPAVLCHRMIERPLRYAQVRSGVVFVRYGLATSLLGAVCLIVILQAGFPFRYKALASESKNHDETCLLDYGTSKPELSSECYPRGDTMPVVVLWGDSHAAALRAAVRAQAHSDGLQFAQFTKSACLPLIGVSKEVQSHPTVAGECLEFNKSVLQLVLGDGRVTNVILAGRWEDPFVKDAPEPLVCGEPMVKCVDGELKYQQSLRRLIDLLTKANKRVILVRDVPNLPFDPQRMFRTSIIPSRRLIAGWIEGEHRYDGIVPASEIRGDAVSWAILQAQAQETGAGLIDLRRRFCSEQSGCIYQAAGNVLYWDKQHLSIQGAEFAGQGVSLLR